MSFRVLSSGSHQQIVNGKNIVNKRYGVSMDSNRNKSKQVQALVVNNNKQYKFQDSLEHFLRKMSSNKSSLFDLLEKEKKAVASNIKSNILIETRKARKARKAIKARKATKAKRARKAIETRKAKRAI